MPALLPTSALVIPPAPAMPGVSEDRRSRHQAARMAILREDYEDVLDGWLRQYVAPEVLEKWGEPDSTNNPLSAYARQLSTPGRYGRAPVWSHAEQEAAAGLVGAGGALERAGYSTKLQMVERYAIGCGDYLVRLDVVGSRLQLQLVDPSEVYIEASPDEPDRPTAVWWRRAREHTAPIEGASAEIVWTWDVYQLGTATRPAAFRIMGYDGSDLVDHSERYLRRADGTYGPLVGRATREDAQGAEEQNPYPYPYTYSSGAPFLPWVIYRSVDSGRMWNWSECRGLHRGTLNVGAYATYTSRAALDATGSTTFAWGLEPAGVDTRLGEGSPGSPVRSVPLTPGTIMFCDVVDGTQPNIKSVGPGVNLESLSKFTRGYTADLQRQRGLGGADAQRQAANPTSGSALYISDQQRREYSEQVEPLFRRSDLRLVGIAAALLNAATGSAYPERGYSVVYYRIPKSPQQQKDQREAQDWEVERGYRSKIDVYMERNAGVSRADAVLALQRIQADHAEITKEPTNADQLPPL